MLGKFILDFKSERFHTVDKFVQENEPSYNKVILHDDIHIGFYDEYSSNIKLDGTQTDSVKLFIRECEIPDFGYNIYIYPSDNELDLSDLRPNRIEYCNLKNIRILKPPLCYYSKIFKGIIGNKAIFTKNLNQNLNDKIIFYGYSEDFTRFLDLIVCNNILVTGSHVIWVDELFPGLINYLRKDRASKYSYLRVRHTDPIITSQIFEGFTMNYTKRYLDIVGQEYDIIVAILNYRQNSIPKLKSAYFLFEIIGRIMNVQESCAGFL